MEFLVISTSGDIKERKVEIKTIHDLLAISKEYDTEVIVHYKVKTIEVVDDWRE